MLNQVRLLHRWNPDVYALQHTIENTRVKDLAFRGESKSAYDGRVGDTIGASDAPLIVTFNLSTTVTCVVDDDGGGASDDSENNG